MGVVVQPVNYGRIATDAKVRDRGRVFFLSHAVPTRNPYKIITNYVILGKGLSEKLKKKRIITQQYFSFHLINKYNKDIDNIFIGVFKSVFMAHAGKRNWIRIAASPQYTDGTTVAVNSVDLSAYVDPLHSLAFRIVSVRMTLMENDVPYGLIDSGATANTPTPYALQMATGTQTAILRPSDGKVIYHLFASYMHDIDATTGTDRVEWQVKDIWPDGYIAVVDTLTVSAQSETAFGANYRYAYTLSGYQEKVTSNQLASLLVAQTA